MLTSRKFSLNKLALVMGLLSFTAWGEELANLLPTTNPLTLPAGQSTSLWVPGGTRWVGQVLFDVSTPADATKLSVIREGTVKCVLDVKADRPGLQSCEISEKTNILEVKNEGATAIQFHEVFAQTANSGPNFVDEWRPPAEPVRPWKSLSFQKFMALPSGKSVSVPLPHEWVEAEAIYLSLLGRKLPCDGLYVIANGDIKTRLTWSTRRAAYRIPIEAPVQTIELVNTCAHPFDLVNLYVEPLPAPQVFLDTKRVVSRSVREQSISNEINLPFRLNLSRESVSLKSVLVTVETAKSPEKTGSEVLFKTNNFESRIWVFHQPGVQVFSIPVFRSTDLFSLEQKSGPPVKIKDIVYAYYADMRPVWDFDDPSYRRRFAFEPTPGKMGNYLCKRLIDITERLKRDVPVRTALPAIARIQNAAVVGQLASTGENSDLSARTLLALKEVWIKLVESRDLIDNLLDIPLTKERAEEIIAIKFEIEPRIQGLLDPLKKP